MRDTVMPVRKSESTLPFSHKRGATSNLSWKDCPRGASQNSNKDLGQEGKALRDVPTNTPLAGEVGEEVAIEEIFISQAPCPGKISFATSRVRDV